MQRRRYVRRGTETVTCGWGQVIDLSATGVRLRGEGRTPIKPDEVKPLTLIHGGRRMRLRTRLAWKKRVGLRGWEIGLAFMALSPGAIKLLGTLAEYGFITDEARAEAARSNRRPAPTDPDEVYQPLYDHLGLQPGATLAELKTAFHRVARACHPDVCDDPAKHVTFQRASEAYHALSDRLRQKAA